MPRKAKKSQTKKPKPTSHTKEEILALIEKVSAARAAGATITKALEEVGVPKTTFFKWRKKFSSPAPKAPAKKSRPKPRGKGEAAARAVLDQVAKLCKMGETQAAALRQAGVSMSTYRYWLKKYVAGGAAKAVQGVKRASVGKREPVLNVLERMTENRKKRQELDNQIRDLDAEFEALRKQLGK